MRKLIRFIQNLSLDITVGSVVMTLFVAAVLEVNITLSMVIGLGIAIWLIYTADHLLDAYKSKKQASNPRHAFHQNHFKTLLGTAGVVFAIGLWNVGFLPASTIWIGLVLAGLSIAYLSYSYYSKRGVNKEFFAAIVYAIGVSVAPISRISSLTIESLLLVFILIAIAYANLLIVSIFEESVDRLDQVESVAIRKKNDQAIHWAYLTLLIATGASLFGLLRNELSFAYIILMMMIAVLYLSLRFRQKLPNSYRILCDGIFLIPLIYWL